MVDEPAFRRPMWMTIFFSNGIFHLDRSFQIAPSRGAIGRTTIGHIAMVVTPQGRLNLAGSDKVDPLEQSFVDLLADWVANLEGAYHVFPL